ncbi:ATP synthase f1, delta subunit [Heliomicrobium modesticaldum Ice1]|uniref:ATP synthase subunit delta n=1 Tax=Heliobacterium modesticaldum (strain ATCC 51547 / Ice1) TaxID=498761 RepID=ATPD_HELMI|nr:ATP synthase F1 subunit delta [Heliomicrobium modesticaldum]B0TI53.1 RecName: Full=ATP synthase subunit delta; AltName: Full=ATP synthase F(1) sector subunit delta; AltName: Full=F-type ATPase subunit delta; Short=F-ATPase subunit delta [Heliomicrobium modesticaldum Ice1]ABZ83473.1 ATP synthase f1, delta subunit [Heliomicrobium modesticaldum Ice1]
MLTGAVARRYAQALLEIGIQTKTLDALEGELGRFVEMIGHPELQRFLFHPSIVVAEKKDLVGRLLATGAFSETARAFILLVIDRRRESYFADIFREFVRLANKVRNIEEARVTSAVELAPEQVERLRSQLAAATGKAIVLRMAVDPDLIGGLVVAFGDRIIDGSVAGKIRDLRESLLRSPLPSLS